MQIDSHAARAMEATARTARGKQGRGPWARLLDSLLALAGGQAELLSHAERPWASATFSGTRHTAALSFTGGEAVEAAEHLIAALPDHEFHIPGQLVADAAVVEARLDMLPVPTFVIEVELLLLDDD
ncbi:MAG: hypothetical protein ACKOUT_01970 [Novosphingobium sp.]